MPSSAGIAMSSVTTSGSSAWICRSASWPSRAVPTTRNSSHDVMSSETSLRMKALSSTTSTVRCLEDTLPHLERADGDAAVGQIEVDAASVVAAGVVGEDGDVGRLEHPSRRLDVALAHVHSARRKERREHAGAADDLRRRLSPCAHPLHLLHQERYGGGRKLRAVAGVARQPLARQEDVRQSADLRRRIVEHDGDAGAESDRRDDGLTVADREVGDLHPDLAHRRWKMRSRASTATNWERTGPSSVSTFPSTRKPPGARASRKREKSSSWLTRSK